MEFSQTRIRIYVQALLIAGMTWIVPVEARAIQLHLTSEGIITHQMGHVFFLISMVVLIFTISGKGLDKQKGWRFIQFSALFFILWNMDAFFGHFLDNQLHIVSLETFSFNSMRIKAHNNSRLLYWVYYFLKLDHLLAVPAMLMFYLGLSTLVKEKEKEKV